ncbi:MAG: GNAT family N-acetyltransferase [Myxococcota bacterium]
MATIRPVPSSARLRYAPFEDIDSFHALVVDPYIRRYLFDGESMSRGWTETTLQKSSERDAESGLGLWRVRRQSDGETIGFCGFFVFGEEVGPTPQLIFAVKETFAGRGFATEMGRALIQHARRHAGLEEIPSCMDEPNRGSLRVLLKLGFDRVGEVPGAFGEKILMRLSEEATAAHPRTRVYLATSLDGFISGPEHDLSWLPEEVGVPSGDALDFESFDQQFGAILMGRTTFDVASGLDSPWPHSRKPVLVATNRTLKTDIPNVRAERGAIQELVGRGLEAADGRDLYLDGGALVRAGLDAGLVDELVLTLIPCVLGGGSPLFTASTLRSDFELTGSGRLGESLVQVLLRPRPRS